MNKKLERSDLQQGDILIFPAPKDSWLSQSIALLTGSQVSHAALMYEVGEKQTLAEATIGGIKYTPLPNEFPFVYRYDNISKEQQEKLVHVMQSYVAEGNDYGYSDLVLLGILLLYKQFSKKTLSNKLLYLFILLISIPLQKAVSKLISKGKHPMVCSQFAAQCYTDAECDLKFRRMIIDYGEIDRVMLNTTSKKQKEGIWQTAINLFSNIREHSQLIFEKKNIQDGFLQLLTEEKGNLDSSNDNKLQLGGSIFSVPSLAGPARRLAQILEPILAHQKSILTRNGSSVSTIRNFFVTPADLLINCDNIKEIGQLSEIK